MGTTSCLVFLVVLCSLNPAPDWNRDYAQALTRAKAAHKPMAVFIGTGAEGWKALCAEGELSLETRRLLANHYVCVYVDASEARREKLVRSFEAGQSPLVVLSSQNRDYQAYRHAGKVTQANLAEALQRHAVEDFLESTALRPVLETAAAPVTLAACRT
jgi:hypothetical protein